jgi:hypothetical protein
MCVNEVRMIDENDLKYQKVNVRDVDKRVAWQQKS